MSLGIIVYTGEDFDFTEKGCFLYRCLSSIRRQSVSPENTVVLCGANDTLTKEAMKEINIKTRTFKKPAKGINTCIEKLQTSHFMIARYDSIFAPDAVKTFSKCDEGCGMVFNVATRVEKGKSDIAPIYEETNKTSQLNTSLNVWNMIFDKKTVQEGQLQFKDFKYADQYLFIARYMSLCQEALYEDSVQMCLDRSVNVQLKTKMKFYRNRDKEILETAKLIKSAGDKELLVSFSKEIAFPMLQISILSDKKEDIKYLKKLDKKFKKAVLG